LLEHDDLAKAKPSGGALRLLDGHPLAVNRRLALSAERPKAKRRIDINVGTTLLGPPGFREAPTLAMMHPYRELAKQAGIGIDTIVGVDASNARTWWDTNAEPPTAPHSLVQGCN
jgi:hypothetical protein